MSSKEKIVRTGLGGRTFIDGDEMRRVEFTKSREEAAAEDAARKQAVLSPTGSVAKPQKRGVAQ